MTAALLAPAPRRVDARCRASSAPPLPLPPEHGVWRAALADLSTERGHEGSQHPHDPGSPPNDVAPPAPATVMIVDDERDIRFLLRFVLEKHGYRVVEAVHGASAVEMIRAESPALIITDLMMPVMDGAELIEFLRGAEATSTLPTILVTACPERGPLDLFDHVMRKPFTPDEIAAAVAMVLARAHA